MTAKFLKRYGDAVRARRLIRGGGRVRQVQELAIEATGLDVGVGDECELPSAGDGGMLRAEVVRVNSGSVTLMPFGSVRGLRAGTEVFPVGARGFLDVGPELLGRVIDPFGVALDSGGPLICTTRRSVMAPPIHALARPRLSKVLETGVRSIDSLLTIAQGQRVGLFAGSGVGKSTLLGMIAGHAKADVNVIALVGERGREVREFIEKHLGAAGLARSVVVVATADQPPLARIRAAYTAVTIAEFFRDAGNQVLLMMDSVTRLAMARREVGLAAGEPPTARGYTPSVFAELPRLCERCGAVEGAGAITALMTVLVEGDDLNEPVADHLRATLDGHIVLSRSIAHTGRYPAIDVLQSASRVMPDVVDAASLQLAARTVRLLAVLERNRQAVEIGVYERGTNDELDSALSVEADLMRWFAQSDGGMARGDAIAALRTLVGRADAREGKRVP